MLFRELQIYWFFFEQQLIFSGTNFQLVLHQLDAIIISKNWFFKGFKMIFQYVPPCSFKFNHSLRISFKAIEMCFCNLKYLEIYLKAIFELN